MITVKEVRSGAGGGAGFFCESRVYKVEEAKAPPDAVKVPDDSPEHDWMPEQAEEKK